MNSPFISFRLPEELLTKIRQMSKESGLPVSEIIRACIVRALPYVESKIQERITG